VHTTGFAYQLGIVMYPITYFYNEEQNNIICYSGNGRKINAVSYEEHTGSIAKAILRQFSTGVKKIILNQEQRALNFINQFSIRIYDHDIPIVFTINIEGITGKRKEFQS
jgi:hypothetical protein